MESRDPTELPGSDAARKLSGILRLRSASLMDDKFA